MNPDDPRHGTTRGYHAGCHGACCRAAMARYEKQGRLARLSGGRAVPALGAQRRLQALMTLGWSSHRIATEAGLPHRNHVWRLINGQKGKPTQWIQRSTYKWVCDVYDKLSMELPEGRYVDRTRNYAIRQGWSPPLAWDDIDAPSETPKGAGYKEELYAKTSRKDTLQELVDAGSNISEACRRLKTTQTTLEKWCERNSLSALFRTLKARESPVFDATRNQYTKGAA